jgi:hypothetical protein
MPPKGHPLLLASLLSVCFPTLLWLATHSKPVAAEPSQSMSRFTASNSARQEAVKAYRTLPLSFEANRGQTDGQVKFVARGEGYTLFLTPRAAVFSLRGYVKRTSENLDLCGESGAKVAVAYSPGQSENCNDESDAMRIELVGANAASEVAGVDELPGRNNYFVGNDPQKWRTNVPTYAKVRYRNVYPGIDLIFYGNQHELEHDFIVAPGANPRSITLGFDHAGKFEIDTAGDLVLRGSGGEVRLYKPLVYQESQHGRQTVAANYVLKGGWHVGFEIANYDRKRPLVIDPVLGYSTYLGGSGDDFGNAIALDASGMVYIAGQTASSDFPFTAGAYQTSLKGGSDDAFVAKFDPTKSGAASLIYSTYVGGSGTDRAFGIAVDPSTGVAYIAGDTNSTDFPTMNAYSSTFGGGNHDAFVTRLNAAGSTLLYSTYLGGSGDDHAFAIAADATGKAYATGTTSNNFPTTAANALQATQAGGGIFVDAFVAKIDTTLSGSPSLVYSSYLGGANGETDGYAIAADSAGHAYITGETFASTSFPITGSAFQPNLATVGQGDSGFDAFMTKLDTTQAGAASLIYSTYLGGANLDVGNGIAIDPGCAAACNVYVVGSTLSINFPTKNAFQAAPASAQQAFVTKFSSSGGVTYSTYLGGNTANGSEDLGFAIAADASGDAYVTGRTDSTNFPAFRSLQAMNGGGVGDAYLTKFDPSGKLLLSSYLGGNGQDRGFGIALDGAAVLGVYITGITNSTNFPTSAGAYQAQVKSGFDAFLTKVDDSEPDFGLVVVNATGTSICAANDSGCSMAVSQGGTATYNLEVVPFNGFNGAVAIGCSGTPTLTTCNPPASVTSNNYQFSVNVVTKPRSSNVLRFPRPGSTRIRQLMFPAAVLILGALVVGIFTVRRARWIFSATTAVVLISLLSACGGGGGGSGGGGGGNGGGGTIPGPYNFTITGNNQTINRTITLNLQVNKS